MRSSLLEPAQDRARPQTDARFAGFWIRFSAALIDQGLLAIAFCLPGLISIPAGSILLLLALTGNSVVCLGRWGQTAGMAAAALRMTREDGSPVRYGRAILREVAEIVMRPFLGICYLWIIVDPRKQALHDKAARTLVWQLERPIRSSARARALFLAACAGVLVLLLYAFSLSAREILKIWTDLDLADQVPLAAVGLLQLREIPGALWCLSVAAIWVAAGAISLLVLVVSGRCPAPNRKIVLLMLTLLLALLAGAILLLLICVGLPLVNVLDALRDAPLE